MAIVIGGINVPPGCTDDDIKNAAAKKLNINESLIEKLRVKKQSLDCRKADIKFVYTLSVNLKDKNKQREFEKRFGEEQEYTAPEIVYGQKKTERPLIVGAGPCGLFAALTLAQNGYRPLLIERGCEISGREKDVARLMQEGILDEDSNVCFGAGGAGAFSDGKLTTRIKDKRAELVLKTLADCGAPKEILYLAKPHMGTQNIRKAVSAIIKEIESLGGEVRYKSRLSELSVKNGSISGAQYVQNALPQSVETGAVILAIGHSARDTYEMLEESGVVLVPKPFAIGLRIEHKRELIDEAQYGDAFSHPALGAAEYRVSTNINGRGFYTFCMCPGGEVVCSATEKGGLAVNGMSYYARDNENSNSAVVVSVGADDFPPGALGGIEFQREFERAAFSLTGGYAAPVSTYGDFLAEKVTKKFGDIRPSYKPDTVKADLNKCLPEYISSAIKSGIADFGRKIKGFDIPQAVLTGVETRTSSPIRILREKDMQSSGIKGLFPAGEGAGYAGGIMSAAVDGIKCAEAVMRIFARPV